MTTNFRSRLKRGDTLLGTMVTLPCVATAEVLADLGFDWFFLDGEHGPLEIPDILAILQAVSHRVACVVRVPIGEEAPIKRVLDVGAVGVIVPQVNTPEAAAHVVSCARYAPEGSRGVGIARAHGYGMRFNEYIKEANDQVAVIVQAEHKQAVENIDAITDVPGIDAVLLGPYDLSASLGKMGQLDDPSVTDAIDRVTETCKRKTIPLGMFGLNSASVQPHIENGYSLIVAGVDTLMLGNAAKTLLQELRTLTGRQE